MDTTGFFFHYDYFDEARQFGQGNVGWYVIRIADPANAPAIAGRIDAEFANSAAETKTTTEKAFLQAFAQQVGDIGAIIRGIVSAVFFTILLVAANTMAQSVRERTSELAVLKTLGRNEWAVVGVFDSGGTLWDCELWCDAGVLQPAYQRGTTFQTVFAKLESAEAFAAFKDALTSDPRVNLRIQRETDYYAEQSAFITQLATTIGAGIALLMGIGAVFGAVNTMYTAVAARTREIATLRALGFGGGPVVVSVLAESLFLGLLGGLIGGALAYLAFNGFQTSTMNWQSFSQVAFAFSVTPGLVASGIAYAMVMGLVDGLLPAVRAARLPVVSALRELSRPRSPAGQDRRAAASSLPRTFDLEGSAPRRETGSPRLRRGGYRRGSVTAGTDVSATIRPTTTATTSD